jgi:hypothetical protein
VESRGANISFLKSVINISKQMAGVKWGFVGKDIICAGFGFNSKIISFIKKANQFKVRLKLLQ